MQHKQPKSALAAASGNDIAAAAAAAAARPPPHVRDRPPSDVAADALAQWARDINRLSDDNVAQRRRALQSLHAGVAALAAAFAAPPPLPPLPPPPPTDPLSPAPSQLTAAGEEVMGRLLDALARPLFARFADPGEGCRELALRLALALLRGAADLTPHLAYLFPALAARGVPPGAAFDAEAKRERGRLLTGGRRRCAVFVHDADEHEAYRRGVATERQDRTDPLRARVVEPSEELRLLLCRLAGGVARALSARGAAAVLRPYFDDAVLLLACQLRDPYPTLKAEACKELEWLACAPAYEAGMAFYATGLARALLPLLRHRHARVRAAAARALWKPAGSVRCDPRRGTTCVRISGAAVPQYDASSVSAREPPRHTSHRARCPLLSLIAARQLPRQVVMVPDRARCKGAGTEAIVDLVGFREDNVIPVASFYGRGDTSVNCLADLVWDPSACADAAGGSAAVLEERRGALRCVAGVAVRAATVGMVGAWLTELPDRYDHNTRLLPYLLAALTDEARPVADAAMAALQTCGAEYEREHEQEVIERRQYGVDGDARANHARPLPPPFGRCADDGSSSGGGDGAGGGGDGGGNGRPRIGVRLYARSLTRRFLRPLLAELSNWVSRTRARSALLLRTLVVLCEESLTMDAHALLPGLHGALLLAWRDADAELEGLLLEVAELVGRPGAAEAAEAASVQRRVGAHDLSEGAARIIVLRSPFVPPEAYLPLLLPRVQGDAEVAPGGTDAAARAAHLLLLAELARGTAPRTLLPHLSALVAALAPEDAVEVDPPSVRDATLRALTAVLATVGGGGGAGARAAAEAHYLATGRLAALGGALRAVTAYALACEAAAPAAARACLDGAAALAGHGGGSGGSGGGAALVAAQGAAVLDACVARYPPVAAWALSSRPHAALLQLLMRYPGAVRRCGGSALGGVIGLLERAIASAHGGGTAESAAAAELAYALLALLRAAPEAARPSAAVPAACAADASWTATLSAAEPRLLDLCTRPGWAAAPALTAARLDLLLHLLELPRAEAAAAATSAAASRAPATAVQLALLTAVAARYAAESAAPAAARLRGLDALEALLERCRRAAGAAAAAPAAEAATIATDAAVAARTAFAALCGRLSDADDGVAVRAAGVMGALLPLLAVSGDDAAHEGERQCGGDCSSGGGGGGGGGAPTLAALVEACLSQVVLAGADGALCDALDVLLRRAAVVDARAFGRAVATWRAAAAAEAAAAAAAPLSADALQLLSELEDHAEVLLMLSGRPRGVVGGASGGGGAPLGDA
ncbi:hypothetical protein JKP88DRAFT_333726 [Tribonema minus]|uniref:Uncharacterized protein n=1 Tax=Tribonema minus TaxID=303371 RepID=A0A836C9Q8_9STRA|nr:hypothetical protein JKP88DRAFT_333726 [Tribonema minus]